MASARPKLRWLPLEANPEVYTKWAEAFGLDTTKYCFEDVLSLEEDTLGWVSQPVKAVILLFPITKEGEAVREAEDAAIAADQSPSGQMDDIVYFRQTIGNACGTYALLHALANANGLDLTPGPLTELYASCRGKTPTESAILLEDFKPLATVHETVASAGQTHVPDVSVRVDDHYLAFVEHGGDLVELDGIRKGPVNHGKIEVGLLEDAVAQIRKIVAVSNSIHFNVITLGPKQ